MTGTGYSNYVILLEDYKIFQFEPLWCRLNHAGCLNNEKWCTSRVPEESRCFSETLIIIHGKWYLRVNDEV